MRPAASTTTSLTDRAGRGNPHEGGGGPASKALSVPNVAQPLVPNVGSGVPSAWKRVTPTGSGRTTAPKTYGGMRRSGTANRTDPSGATATWAFIPSNHQPRVAA